ncbi:MAG: polysaccharide deacetylase family protein [Anaerolineae bacterium]
MARKVILSFDMEPDIGSWTSSCRGVEFGTPEILGILATHNVQATFLFTGREALAYPQLVAQVMAAQHEIGCHTMYHETLGDAVFSMPGDAPVLESEIAGRLALATKTIERVAGVRPVSFRAPRLFGSTKMVQVLADLGYIADSSLPAYFFGRSFLPYCPSESDWTKPGGLPMVEIPVFYDVEAGDDCDKHRSRDQWPMLRLKGREWFVDLCRRLFLHLERTQEEAPLCVYLHPWEFVPVPETIVTDEASITFKPFLHRHCGDYALTALDEFISEMKRLGASFTTLRDFASAWLIKINQDQVTLT